VKIMTKAADASAAQALIAPIEARVRERLPRGIFGADAVTLEGAIGSAFERRSLALAIAESCTGGAIAARLVGVSGISKTFRGAVVAYSNESKTALLDVDTRLIECHGAVSEQVALAMARGAKERFEADIALATTGIAGPEGGSAEKPVGLVWYALATPEGEKATKAVFPGDRGDVIRRATTRGLGLLWRYVEERGWR